MIGKKKKEDYSDTNISTNVEKLTNIADGTVVHGALAVDGNLRLDGTVEGGISCTGKMVIGPKGHVKGNVRTAGLVLHGFLEGDVHASDDLVLKSNCIMKGDIYTVRLEIEPQAKFNGVCNTLDSSSAVVEPVLEIENKKNHKAQLIDVSN